MDGYVKRVLVFNVHVKAEDAPGQRILELFVKGRG
jgi:hypothetical protein